MPPFVFNKHRLFHGTDAGNRKVVEAENGGSPHLETPERFHILESSFVHVGHNIEVEAHGVFPLFVEGETVDPFGKVHIGTHLRIFAVAETETVAFSFVFDPVPVVPVVIGKDIADLIVEIPSLKFGVFALDGGVAGSALFKISVGDVVFQFDSGIFADKSGNGEE